LKKSKTYWRINHNIHAPEVRVIDEKDKQLGVLKLSEALNKADKAKLDLVEIAPNAKPPVAKIIDFGKFRYQERKKEKSQKKGAKSGDLKEIRFSPFIGEADYNTRLQRIKEFLEEKSKIRLVVKFKGRQMGSKQFGYNLLKRINTELGDTVVIDMEPKFLGRHLTMVISPTTKKVVTKKKDKEISKEKKDAKTKNS
jgi:translation initiation factor IF-3